MRIDVKTEITDYDGNSIAQGKEGSPSMTLGSMMIVALNTPLEAEKDLSAAKKVARAVLSQNIHNAMKSEKKGAGVIDIDPKEVAEAQELLNHFYAPLPLMRAFSILDPKPEEVAKESK